MPTFKEANHVRSALKMKLVNYAWYSSCNVQMIDGDYGIVVSVKYVDNSVRKVVSPIIDDVVVKVQVE